MLHHACEPTHPEPTSQDTLHLTHPCFELCRNNPEQMTPRMCAANPEPTFQRYTTKPQTVRFSSHTSVLNFAGAAPHVTPHMCANPSWTNVPRHTTNFRSENFHLKHPYFELCRNRLHHACVPTQPEPTFQRHTTKPQTPRFSSHTSLFWNFVGAALHITPHMWANPSWTNVPRHTTNFRSDFFHLTHPCFELCRNSSPCYTTHVSQPILNQRPKTHYKLQIWKYSSHTSLFWTLPEQITPRMWANPSWTDVPKTHYKLQIRFVWSHTSLFWACYTTHVSQPILYQRPKIHHKRLMTQFCKPILIQPPKIHLSKFQCSPYRRQKCRALQEDKVEWPVCDLQAKMVLSKLQWLKLPAPNLLQKCSQEVFPRLKSFGFMVYLKSQF